MERSERRTHVNSQKHAAISLLVVSLFAILVGSRGGVRVAVAQTSPSLAGEVLTVNNPLGSGDTLQANSVSIDNVNVAGGLFTATNVSSTCTATETGATGDVTIINGLLDVGGSPLAVDSMPAPNTVVTTLNDIYVTAIFNEQVVEPNGTLTVTAVRLISGDSTISDIIIGQVRCALVAPPVVPISTEQCKNGGYQTFIDPSTRQPFKNEGQCIQFVNTGK